VIENPLERILKSELYGLYRRWAGFNGIKPVPSQTFSTTMREKGYTQRRSGKGKDRNYYWLGIEKNVFVPYDI